MFLMRINSVHAAATVVAVLCALTVPTAGAVAGGGERAGRPFEPGASPGRRVAMMPRHASGMAGPRYGERAGFRAGPGRFRASYGPRYGGPRYGGGYGAGFADGGYPAGNAFDGGPSYAGGAVVGGLLGAGGLLDSGLGAGFGGGFGGPGPAYGSAGAVVPTTVYRPVTRSYTVPVHGFQTVERTRLVPVTSYRPVTTAVQVPVTTYRTFQRTEQVPTLAYQQVCPPCPGCAFGE